MSVMNQVKKASIIRKIYNYINVLKIPHNTNGKIVRIKKPDAAATALCFLSTT